MYSSNATSFCFALSTLWATAFGVDVRRDMELFLWDEGYGKGEGQDDGEGEGKAEGEGQGEGQDEGKAVGKGVDEGESTLCGLWMACDVGRCQRLPERYEFEVKDKGHV